MLEAGCHDDSVFATLTYEQTDGSLHPRDLQLFMKRLRKRMDLPVRFFGVGEYGDITWRPHYHVALFGVSLAEDQLVRESWGLGHVDVGDLTRQSAAYIAGYVVKKLTAPDDPRLEGRHPEFARMSNRPGIGALAARGIGNAFTKRGASTALVEAGDVPTVARIDGKKMPLGRYLRSKIREEVGWDAKAPKEVSRRVALERSFETGKDLERKKEARKAHALRAEKRSKISASKGKL